MIDKVAFFALVRPLFGGKLTQDQVDGLNAILAAMPAGTPPTHLAYALATTFHETAFTMQPIREIGRGKGRRYGRPDPTTGQTYFGRGFVQLTWKENYARAGKELGYQNAFVLNADRVMEPDIAAAILWRGMREGWFTGKKLADFLNDRLTDWRGARRIINGMDKADLIAGHARRFHAAILAALEPEKVAKPEAPSPLPAPEPARPVLPEIPPRAAMIGILVVAAIIVVTLFLGGRP